MERRTDRPEGYLEEESMSTEGLEERRVLSASNLMGNNVVNPEGDTLGQLKDIMLDMVDGRIAYAVLAFGGVLGIGEKLFAIPWEALEVDQVNDQIILDVPYDKLKNAPGFDKDNWPDMADPQWGSQIYSYYGYRPYWEP